MSQIEQLIIKWRNEADWYAKNAESAYRNNLTETNSYEAKGIKISELCDELEVALRATRPTERAK